MITVAFVLGILLPTLNGWLLLRLAEGRTPVLLTLERWSAGFLAGLTGTMTLTYFLSALAGLPFSRGGFLSVQLLLIAALSLLLVWRLQVLPWRSPAPILPPSPPMRRRAAALLIILGLWTAAKIGMGAVILLTTPPGFDDTVKNWNFRGKIFFQNRGISRGVPGSDADLVGQLHSYPPAVSLSKTWLAALAGRWHEGLANSIHLAWFAAALLLFFAFLRRSLPLSRALLGTYLLVSIPLFLIHGTQAYAEIFLAAHLLAAVSFLLHAAGAQEHADRRTFLRLAAVTAALLPLTKNEGLALYLPPLLLAAVLVLWWLRREGKLYRSDVYASLFWFAGALAVTTVPWLAYKWLQGLTFGNARGLGETAFSWDPAVFQAAAVNLFFEGNWLLLFPLLLVLLILGRKAAFRPPLLFLTLLTLLLFFFQLSLFLFTNLQPELLFQTGYGRGVVQLMPLLVALGVFLGYSILGERK